jgi:hypothetical protein
MMDLQKQSQTIDHLRDAVEQTKALYQSAKDEFNRAVEYQIRINGSPECLRSAKNVRNLTLRYYRQALKNFNGFILRGYAPALSRPSQKNITLKW